MAKRTILWAIPGVAFIVALTAMVLTGPSWATLSRRTVMAASSNGTVGCKDCCSADLYGVMNSNSGAGGGNAQYCALSACPVNYYTGEKILSTTDLVHSGFDGMKVSLHFTSLSQYVDGGFGPGWRTGIPQLIDMGSQVHLVMGSRHARSWTKVVDGGGAVTSYTPDFFYKETLTIIDGDTLLFKDEDGNGYSFYNFTHSNSVLRGKMVAQYNAYFSSATSSGSITYVDYLSTGELMNRVQYELVNGVADLSAASVFHPTSTMFDTPRITAIEQSVVIGGVQQPSFRYVNYEYYDGTLPANGAAGLLMRTTITDEVGSVIERKYFRYGAVVGNRVPLRTVVLGPAYERLKADPAVGSDAAVLTASDAKVNEYADTFTYDSNQRVVSEAIQGKGTYTFAAPVDSAFADDVNFWKRKTVETLPDGNQNIVYTTYSGQPILKVFQSGGQQWCTYFQYDAQARLILEATPAAVQSFTESSATLVTLKTSAGLIKLTNYADTTTGSESPPVAGDVQGYVKSRQVKIGSAGTPITIEAYTYLPHTADQYMTTWTFPIATKTVYEDTAGTQARTTTYTYTWQVPPGSGASNQIESVTTTHPIVSTGKNGSNAATSTVQFFDKWRHPTYFKDEDGFIQRKQWNRLTGAMTQHIVDVNTATTTDEPAGWTTPGGGGLHLTTNYVDDLLGRWTKITDPIGNVTCTVYKDSNWEVRTYPGWTGTATTGPTQVARKDKAGSYSEEFTTSVTPASSGGLPTGAEALDGTSLTASTLHSLQRILFDAGNRVTSVDSYFTFAGLTYTTGTSYGTLGTNFFRETRGYDSKGRPNRTVDPTGTITRTVYDARDRVSSSWIGTDDTPTSGTWSPANLGGTNTIQTMGYEYDGNGIGNSTLTKSRFFTAAATSLDTLYQYDPRDRQTDERSPRNVAVKRTLDNLGRATIVETYASSDFTYTTAELRAKQETKFDEKGQVYQTIVHNVDPASGALGNRLTTNFWSNARGMGVKIKGPNGEFQKTQFDGAGRVKAQFLCYDDSEPNTDYLQAFSVDAGGPFTADTVISQSVPSYDADSNVIQTTQYERTNSTAKTGDLSVSWAETDSRRTYAAAWFDAVNRTTSVVDYGRNGGATFSRPGTPPAPNTSDAYIVTKYEYDTAGRQYRLTDNKARITERTFDALGRVTKKVENWQIGFTGTPTETELETDRTTEWVYDGSGRLWKMNAYNPKGLGQGVEIQTTKYVYGTNANPVWRNDLLVAEIYPDSDDVDIPLGNGADSTYDRIEYTYDYASRKITWKLQDTTLHTYTYDSVGRPFTDQATTLGSGIDGAIRRIETAYDSLSRPLTVGSYSATSGGTLRNQVRYTYDGWGNELKCEQGHEGTATGAPSYQKTFADGAPMPSGTEAKYVRLTQSTYPNARIVYRNYLADTTVGGKLSRVDNIANDSSGTLKFAQMTYLGMGSVVKIAHPGVTGGLNLDYGTGTGNPGGWDDLGRIDDQKWQNDSSVIKDQYQYGYDRTSNRTFRDNLTAVTPPNDAKDFFYTYNGLDQVLSAKKGNLNAGRTDITGTPASQETWTLESHGNWRALVQATAGTTTLSQTRTHTKANEVTTIAASTGTNWGDGVLDKNGFMTRVPKPGNEGQLWELTSDAWMRVVKVVNNSGGATIAEYKYDGSHRRTVKLKPNGANWDRRDYYYSCEWQVAEERELLNTASKTTVATVPKFQWVWGMRYIDEIVLRDENKNGDSDCTDAGPTDQRLYYAQDANFNVTALVDTANTVVERVLYDGYGKSTLWNAAWSATQASTLYNNEVLYGGYRLNPESGMYQVRHREFHPTLGRWVRRDPVDYHDGMNLYKYVRGRSINLIDPFGLWPDPTPDDYPLNPKGKYPAETASRISYSGVSRKEEAKIGCHCDKTKDIWFCMADWINPEAFCIFDRKNSYQRSAVTLTDDPDLFRHEMGHLKICKKNADQLKSWLQAALGIGEDKSEKNARSKAWNDLVALTQQGINSARQRNDQEQKLYDTETKHGTDAAAQNRWRKKLGL